MRGKRNVGQQFFWVLLTLLSHYFKASGPSPFYGDWFDDRRGDVGVGATD